MEPIRLLIVDDHSLFRGGLRALFASSEDIRLVGEATTGAEAVEQVEAVAPDVILMDLDMPGMSGIEATRRVLRIAPTTGVVVVTMLEDDASVFSAMRAGARGYVLKGAEPNELEQTIRAVANGQALFGPGIASRMMRFFNEKDAAFKALLPEEAFPELTAREIEVLTLIAKGASNQAIAEELVISEKTVKNHITSVFSKLQVADRAAAIIRARSAGMG